MKLSVLFVCLGVLVLQIAASPSTHKMLLYNADEESYIPPARRPNPSLEYKYDNYESGEKHYGAQQSQSQDLHKTSGQHQQSVILVEKEKTIVSSQKNNKQHHLKSQHKLKKKHHQGQQIVVYKHKLPQSGHKKVLRKQQYSGLRNVNIRGQQSQSSGQKVVKITEKKTILKSSSGDFDESKHEQGNKYVYGDRGTKFEFRDGNGQMRGKREVRRNGKKNHDWLENFPPNEEKSESDEEKMDLSDLEEEFINRSRNSGEIRNKEEVPEELKLDENRLPDVVQNVIFNSTAPKLQTF